MAFFDSRYMDMSDIKYGKVFDGLLLDMSGG